MKGCLLMRGVACWGLSGLLLLSLGGVTGCGDGQKTKLPEKTMDVPKAGPVPAGVPAAPGGGEGAKSKGAAAQ
jgi:hypothetical protein